jgi:hypothetical protein
MTSGRHQRKRSALFVFAGVACVAGLPVWSASSSRASITERVVVDRLRGLAIGGFDPVGYFTDHKALLGIGSHELHYAGAVWRFRNVGNRAAFANDPGIYAPVFGGYDPLAVARGVATAGNPQIWLIHKNRLYFFYDTTSRDAFTAQPVFVLAEALQAWPKLEKTLLP